MYDLHLLEDAPFVEAFGERGASTDEDRLFTAALLAATAFRMKDMVGLLSALRSLTDAVERIEREREAA